MRIVGVRNIVRFATLVVTMTLTTGCFNGGSLPETILVELPDGTTTEVGQGGGAASLANSSWQFFQSFESGQGIPFVTLKFNESGGIDRFEESAIASEVFGSTIVFDGARHETGIKGVQYSATTYGAETADATGFTFEGRINAYAAGLLVGRGEASATGTLDPDDPDVMTGIFAYSSELTVPIEIPNAEQNDEFAFLARRVVDGE